MSPEHESQGQALRQSSTPMTGHHTATKAPERQQVILSTKTPVPPPRLISSRHESPQLFVHALQADDMGPVDRSKVGVK
ncbi:hypothetical protein TKK_0013293 [Trichogramma kaykai]